MSGRFHGDIKEGAPAYLSDLTVESEMTFLPFAQCVFVSISVWSVGPYPILSFLSGTTDCSAIIGVGQPRLDRLIASDYGL